MQTKNLIAATIAFASIAIASCKKTDFGDYNINPSPVVSSFPNTAELFTNACISAGYGLATNGDETGFYVQYFMNVNYPNNALYQTTNLGWNGYYAGPLMDLQRIIELNTSSDASNPKVTSNGSAANQLAAARILKAYYYSLVTDKWGNVPYKAALKLDINPAYDLQQNIYPDLIKELKEAEAQFDGGTPMKGDILGNGSIAKWKKFANSLRMVLAMRMVKADATQAKAEFLSAYNDADGYIATNADNFFYQPLSNLNYSSYWYLQYRNRDEVGMSSTFIDWLRVNNDKRINIYANRNANNNFVGIPYGRSASFLSNWKNSNDYSRIGAAITAFDCKANLITASQMLLTKAEAEIRGFIGTPSDAGVSMKAAIKASWDQWGVIYTQTELDNYASGANTAPSLVVNDMIAKIGLQKWVALYPNGHEAWSEWRRLGSPALTPAVDAINDTRTIPRRYAYPLNEPQLNGVSYNAANALLAPLGDVHNNKVWWDK